MRKVIIWGIGKDYELSLNQILFECMKGNISVQALVCRKQDRYCSRKDGFEVITKEEIVPESFDYVIIMPSLYFDTICEEAIQCGIKKRQIIDGRILHIPLFDFSQYAALIENPVTILSDDCWSGFAYNYLRLPFTTPLINIWWSCEEYMKFIQDPLFYLSTELQMVKDGDLRKCAAPTGMLGNSEKNVKCRFVHAANFEEAKKIWDKRKERINPNNLFVKMGFSDGYISNTEKQKAMEIFETVPYRKILFYYGETKVRELFKTERFVVQQMSSKIVTTFNYNDYCRTNSSYDLNLLSLFTGKSEYLRYGED